MPSLLLFPTKNFKVTLPSKKKRAPDTGIMTQQHRDAPTSGRWARKKKVKHYGKRLCRPLPTVVDFDEFCPKIMRHVAI